MKSLLLTCFAAMILVVAPMPAFSAGPPDSGDREVCASWASLARSIMFARQRGAPIDKAMKVFDDLADDSIADKMNQERKRNLVIFAYDLPRFYSDEMQRRAITDFGNDVYLACIKPR